MKSIQMIKNENSKMEDLNEKEIIYQNKELEMSEHINENEIKMLMKMNTMKMQI